MYLVFLGNLALELASGIGFDDGFYISVEENAHCRCLSSLLVPVSYPIISVALNSIPPQVVQSIVVVYVVIVTAVHSGWSLADKSL